MQCTEGLAVAKPAEESRESAAQDLGLSWQMQLLNRLAGYRLLWGGWLCQNQKGKYVKQSQPAGRATLRMAVLRGLSFVFTFKAVAGAVKLCAW